jgi:hypothetical protein
VAEMQVWCGAIDAVLDPEWTARPQPVEQVGLADDGIGGTPQSVDDCAGVDLS